MHESSQTPRPAALLGFTGAAPFLGGLALAFFSDDPLRGWGLWLLLIYGAIILSFMGGVHWGAAMLRDDASLKALGRSVLPSLLALPAAAFGGALGLVLLALGFCGLLVYDESEVRAERLPLWYPKLRRPLTGIVVACLLAGAYIGRH
jgi:hypothetical protein